MTRFAADAELEPLDEATESALDLISSFFESLPRLGVAAVIVAVGYVLSRIVRSLAQMAFQRRQNTPSFSRVMSKITGWCVLGLFTLAATATAFPSVKPVDLLAGLGFFSVAVGFAFQDILENTLAGVLLLFRQPFRSGDQVGVKGEQGTVEAITIRETRIKTFDGQLVVIPNRDVYKSVIRVQTHYPSRRVSFVVGIAYENDAEEACRVIESALTDIVDSAEDPPPQALVKRLGVSTVDIEVGFWAAPEQLENLRMLDRAITVVKRELETHGIEMPADIVALQATPSFKAALQNERDVTPGGGVVADS